MKCIFVAIFCFFHIANSLDLLGLSLSVPALETGELLGATTRKEKEETTTFRPKKPNNTKCLESVTKIKNGKSVCSNSLIFEEYFDRGVLNASRWIQEKFIPLEPDHEFVSYETRAQNCYIKNGYLHLKPTIREDPFINELDLSKGCTRKSCISKLVGNISPPIVSAKITSKFSFVYGRVDIRAQLPKGDWIFPELYLEPKKYEYGEGYKSGRMWVAFARGNENLIKQETGDQIGNSVLYSGAVLFQEEPFRSYSVNVVQLENGSFWGDEFHVYSLIWSPEGISVEVDGQDQGFISPPFSNSGVPYADLWDTDMAPFDQEFVISLGLGVGGHSDFPDGCVSAGNKKPWKRSSVKDNLLFYNSKEQWLPTWSKSRNLLKVDYIKIWSL